MIKPKHVERQPREAELEAVAKVIEALNWAEDNGFFGEEEKRRILIASLTLLGSHRMAKTLMELS